MFTDLCFYERVWIMNEETSVVEDKAIGQKSKKKGKGFFRNFFFWIFIVLIFIMGIYIERSFGIFEPSQTYLKARQKSFNLWLDKQERKSKEKEKLEEEKALKLENAMEKRRLAAEKQKQEGVLVEEKQKQEEILKEEKKNKRKKYLLKICDLINDNIGFIELDPKEGIHSYHIGKIPIEFYEANKSLMKSFSFENETVYMGAFRSKDDNKSYCFFFYLDKLIYNSGWIEDPSEGLLFPGGVYFKEEGVYVTCNKLSDRQKHYDTYHKLMEAYYDSVKSKVHLN